MGGEWGAREDRRVCTSAHDVVPEERHSEPEGQHEQVGLQSGKLPRETGRLRTEIPKSTCHQDTWEAGKGTDRRRSKISSHSGVVVGVCIVFSTSIHTFTFKYRT